MRKSPTTQPKIKELFPRMLI